MSQLSFLDELAKQRRALSVSELTAQVKTLLESRFFDLWVEGEVSNFRRHSSGHWYFSLKDDFASLRCACFRMQNRLLRFTPEDGVAVRARGRLSLFEARGEYQLVVEHLEPLGLGALQFAFEQLKAKLAAEGLLSAGRKRTLPVLPRRIGVVTSPTGAAIRDILRVTKRRNHSVSVLIAPARVQGEGAALEIARAIRLLNSQQAVDVIIVGRGGGSIEDLWCFNEECVARAIAGSPVPVISAIGHETDFTIADFVADLRASTPSAAAELVVTARDEMAANIAALKEDATKLVRYRLLQFRRRLSELDSRRVFRVVPPTIRAGALRIDNAVYSMETSLRQVIKRDRTLVDTLTARLRESDTRRALAEHRSKFALLTARRDAAQQSILKWSRESLSVASGKLDSMSPLAVLARGYAIAFDGNNRIIKRPDDVESGDQIRVRVAEGDIACRKI
jgi:exodeoxyribonuclease VII large subunit